MIRIAILLTAHNGTIEMPAIRVLKICCSALLLLLCSCETTPSGESSASAGSNACPPGEVMTCDIRSSGRISDGRYGRNRQGAGWRKNCGCEPERDLKDLESEPLPQPH